MHARFDGLYSSMGRPSIPPEMLLRATLLQAFFSVRSERMLMQQIDYNLLFRWFVGLPMDAEVWHPTVFTHNHDRLLEAEVARDFLAALLALPKVKGLLSNEHFSVDGTLIDAWASMKSFRPKDGSGEPPGPGRNGERNFHKEKRSNETHASSTDPDARLYRKADGREKERNAERAVQILILGECRPRRVMLLGLPDRVVGVLLRSPDRLERRAGDSPSPDRGHRRRAAGKGQKRHPYLDTWKTAAQSTPALDSSRSRFPAIFLQSAEVAVTKSGSKSSAYEFRTKSAQSGGLETNGPRERISGLRRQIAVRRFAREALGYWRFQRGKIQRRTLAAQGLAEGERLETNHL